MEKRIRWVATRLALCAVVLILTILLLDCAGMTVKQAVGYGLILAISAFGPLSVALLVLALPIMLVLLSIAAK